MEKDKILYVDDEEMNLSGFKTTFRRDYQIFTAISAEEAFKILEKEKMKVIVSDQRMPIMTGVDFLTITATEYPAAKRIILTGFADIEVIIRAINEGSIFRYCTKPWTKDDLKCSIDEAIKLYDLENENKTLLDNLQTAHTKLEMYAETLEEKVKERTSHLLEIIAIRDKLLSIISHDIRQPLNASMGLLELILKQYDRLEEAKKKQFLEVAFDSTKSLVTLIENLLQWVQTQKDAISHTPTSFDVAEVINNTISVLKVSADEKDITVKSSIPENTQIFADKDMIRLAFRNLIANSIKFTNNNGLVEIYSTIDEGKIYFSVKDNGVGIKPEAIDKLFSTSTNYTTKGTNDEKGTGLGLAMVKGFIERGGGTISVKSVLGEGSIFTFTVPQKSELE